MRQGKGTTGKRGMRCGCGFTTTSTSAFFEHKKKERMSREPMPKFNGLRPTKSNPNRGFDPVAAKKASMYGYGARENQAKQKATSDRWREATGRPPLPL